MKIRDGVRAILYCTAIVVGGSCLAPAATHAETNPSQGTSVAVGPPYDSTHVYIAPNDFDAFVNSFVATFGGKASKSIVDNILPVPSSAYLSM
jgi:hypothetical protein